MPPSLCAPARRCSSSGAPGPWSFAAGSRLVVVPLRPEFFGGMVVRGGCRMLPAYVFRFFLRLPGRFQLGRGDRRGLSGSALARGRGRGREVITSIAGHTPPQAGADRPKR